MTPPSDSSTSDVERDVLTTQQAADLLQVQPRKLGELAKQGAIPARLVGARWRFSRSALLEWIEAGEPAEAER